MSGFRVALLACLLAFAAFGGWAPSPARAMSEGSALREVGLLPLSSYRSRPLVRVPFESPSELRGWYETPQTPLTHHVLSGERVYRGRKALKAWVTGANSGNVEPDGPNHRGYPTIQLFKRPRGCRTPCLISLWVWSSIPLARGQWSSIATVTASTGTTWIGQLVNVGLEGWLHTMHAPVPGQAEWILQRKDLPFPSRRWVHLRILVRYRASGGGIAVWQDKRLMSVAPIDGNLDRNGLGLLNQAHFGLYTPPTIASGVIYNDDLVISELRSR